MSPTSLTTTAAASSSVEQQKQQQQYELKLSSEDSYLQTLLAKQVISTVVRAFYDDTHIIIIDYLLTNGFLHDGRNMGKRLKLSTKICRKILTYLKNEEMLVSIENVTGIVETYDSVRKYRRPKTVKFWYINLNLAIKIISLRLQLMHNTILNMRHKATNDSYYVCPGYYENRCDGHYTELEVQNCMIINGQFLCRECYEVHCNNPNAPSISTYTLQLVDQQQDYVDAEQLLTRFLHQMSSKSKSEEKSMKKKKKSSSSSSVTKRKATPTTTSSSTKAAASSSSSSSSSAHPDADADDKIQQQQLRPSIFDLLQKLRNVSTVGIDNKTGNKIRVPITSHLPSENGAIEYIEDRQDTIIPNDDNNINHNMEPSSSSLIIDRNFNGLLYFNNPNNNTNNRGQQRFVLDLEFSTSLGGTTSTRRAFQQATKEWNNYQKQQLDATIRSGLRNISLQQHHHQQQQNMIGNGRQHYLSGVVLGNTAAAAAVPATTAAAAAAPTTTTPYGQHGNDDDPPMPRPAKMTCRNTTPYFLKSEFVEQQPNNNNNNTGNNNNIMNMEDDEDDNQEQATDTAAAAAAAASLPHDNMLDAVETAATAEAMFEANTANMMMMVFPDHNSTFVSRSEYIQQFHSELNNVVAPNSIGYQHQHQQQQGVASTSAGQNYSSSQYNYAEINHHPSNRQTSNSTYGSIGYWVDVDIYDDDDDNKTHNSV